MTLVTKTQFDPATEFEDRVRLHEVSWEDYERLLAMRGEKAVPRITYLDGEVELMVPGQPHEYYKKMLARLLEAWVDEYRVPLNGFGSWTIKQRRKKGGLEADECYILGTENKPRPDLAIEVVWTSGGIDKLEVYRRLGVGEVWFWSRGSTSIDVYVLRDTKYRRSTRSMLLADLDLPQLAGFVLLENQTEAVWAYRRALRGEP